MEIVCLYYIAQITVMETLAGEQTDFISDVDFADAALLKYKKARLMVMRLRLHAPCSYQTEAEEFLNNQLTATARDRIGYFVDRKLGNIKI